MNFQLVLIKTHCIQGLFHIALAVGQDHRSGCNFVLVVTVVRVGSSNLERLLPGWVQVLLHCSTPETVTGSRGARRSSVDDASSYVCWIHLRRLCWTIMTTAVISAFLKWFSRLMNRYVVVAARRKNTGNLHGVRSKRTILVQSVSVDRIITDILKTFKKEPRD